MLESKSGFKRRNEYESVIFPKIGKYTSAEKESFCSAFVVILVFVLLIAFIGYVPVEGSSMMPTINAQGDGAVIVRGLITPDYGDIVIVNNRDRGLDGAFHQLLIKRVVAKGGDTVSLLPSDVRGEEHLLVLRVNGKVVDEPYVKEMLIGITRAQEEITVPEGHYFVLGDNRPVSGDSRGFGPVPSDRIEGVVVWLVGSGGFRFI